MKEEKSLPNCNAKCYTHTHTHHFSFWVLEYYGGSSAEDKEELVLLCSEPVYLIIHVTFSIQCLPKVAATVMNPRYTHVPHITTASSLPVTGIAIDAHVLTAQCLSDWDSVKCHPLICRSQKTNPDKKRVVVARVLVWSKGISPVGHLSPIPGEMPDPDGYASREKQEPWNWFPKSTGHLALPFIQMYDFHLWQGFLGLQTINLCSEWGS